jgi:hypothetical protein
VHLVKLDGEWKVDNVEFSQLSAAGGSPSEQPPTASTTTSTIAPP